MIMKKISLVVAVMVFSFNSIAQKPAWADYYKRQEMYPDNEFLVGFVSAINIPGEDAEKQKSIYEVMAKDRLIQGIQVEIETNSSMNISNINGKSDEEFLSKSVSFSKANVSGLTNKSYYDKKKKEIYAIAFVNRKELAFYYSNLIKSGVEDIEQKLSEGRKYAKKGHKENALKSYYEAMPVLSRIDEARVLLVALNRKMYADLDIDKINSLKLNLINEIDSLLIPEDLNLSESAYFVAYGIFLQLGEIEGALTMDNFSFENTGLNSKFSEKWNQEFASALVKAGSYTVKKGRGQPENKLLVFGNYWKEGEFLKINASVTNNNKIIAVSKGSIPISWLKMENIDFVPEQVKKMEALVNYSIKLNSAPETIKLGMPSTKAIKTEIVDADKKPVQGIPVAITNTESAEKLCSSATNDFGYSLCYLPSLQTNNPILRLEASIDLIEYLGVQENSIYYAIASGQNSVMPVAIDIVTEKPTVFVQSKELLHNYPMDIKTLEPIVKEILAEKGYNFVDNEKNADFIITLNANTTTGSHYQGIYFAYLDANISIVETSSGEEIYKSHLDQVKGGGANYKKAGKKAYILGAEKLKESINNSFFP